MIDHTTAKEAIAEKVDITVPFWQLTFRKRLKLFFQILQGKEVRLTFSKVTIKINGNITTE